MVASVFAAEDSHNYPLMVLKAWRGRDLVRLIPSAKGV
jgi:hypothetical protein